MPSVVSTVRCAGRSMRMIALSLALLCAHASGDGSLGLDKRLSFSGFGSMEIGQFYDFAVRYYEIEHPQWIYRMHVNVAAHANLTERLAAHASIEGKMWYQMFPMLSMIQILTVLDIPTQLFSFYLARAEGVYTLGDPHRPSLQIGIGYFPFKYNPDARNLGEYLFRSGTYPAYVINNFDFAQARLGGLRVSSELFGFLKQDVLFTMETEIRPLLDFNLAYLASGALSNILTLGAGACFRSLISVDDSVTSPRNDNTMVILNPDRLSDGSIVGDTTYYTFRGLKLMGRVSFDPKRIFIRSGSPGIFGEQDLKLYAEAAILGVKNYPANRSNPYGYDTLMHKMPIMIGLNLPAFRLLDLAAFEVEWYGCPYPNSYFRQMVGSPVPDNIQSPKFAKYYREKDNIKWSFYVKKSMSMGLDIIGQVARDHQRTETPFAFSRDYEEALRTDKSWSWMLKAALRF